MTDKTRPIPPTIIKMIPAALISKPDTEASTAHVKIAPTAIRNMLRLIPIAEGKGNDPLRAFYSLAPLAGECRRQPSACPSEIMQTIILTLAEEVTRTKG